MKLSPPNLLPRRGSQSLAQLRALQRTALDTIRLPLTGAGSTPPRLRDGRPTRQVVEQFIKPNDRLTSLERIEIYNRQYWFRLLDCLWDDFPGLRAILGLKKFEKLRVAYLDRYPSRSYSLRNLGSRMAQFLEDQPQYAQPHYAMCMDMARFEWAQVVAFDAEAKAPFTVDDLLGRDPGKLRVSLQPYITLLELGYPLDEFVLAVKKRDASMRGEASNAVDANRDSERTIRVRLPRPKKIYLAVHRLDTDLYYKRLEPQAFSILCRLRDGATVARACEDEIPQDPSADFAQTVQRWFSTWMELGWLCERSAKSKAVQQRNRNRPA